MLSGFRGVALVRASERRESREGGGSGSGRVFFLDLVLGYLMPLGFLNDLGGTGRKDDRRRLSTRRQQKNERTNLRYYQFE